MFSNFSRCRGLTERSVISLTDTSDASTTQFCDDDRIERRRTNDLVGQRAVASDRNIGYTKREEKKVSSLRVGAA